MRRHLPLFFRRGLTGLTICAALCFIGGSSFAGTLTMGSVLPNYAIVSVGSNASLTVNSGPITGNVLVGDGSAISSSGGNNGQIKGFVDVSGSVSGDLFAGLQTPPTPSQIKDFASSVSVQAFDDAKTLSNTASGLTATQTIATINGTSTISGKGGLNVIDVGSLSNAKLTISGNSSDLFVFNVSGTFADNEAMTLKGVSASQILWNLTGSSGNIFSTSGGDVLFGTFVATNGGSFQFSNLVLNGELINTGAHIQFVSGSSITNTPFAPPPTATPEPAALALFGSGLCGIALRMRRTRKR